MARAYFALRALDAQVEATERTLRLREDGLRLQKKRAEAGAGEPGIAAALAAFSAPAREKAAPAQTLLAAPQTVRDKVYPQMVFPPEEYRLLALFRFWNVIHYFFPYKHLTDQPWDSVLPEFIPRMLACKDALDYATAVAELAARIQDTHAWAVTGLYPLENKLGVMAPPLRVGHAAGDKLVVLELMDEAAAQAAGIQRGDVILTIDGEPVAQRLAALAKYRSLSTPQSAYAYVYPSALRGPPGSKAKLRIESGNGEPRDVEIARTVAYFSAMAAPVRRTPVYQVLPNGDGYIDLTRLQQSDAAQALDAVLNTPGLILDMRGYPGGDASALTARLTAKQNVTGLLDRYLLLTPAALRAAESGKGPTYVFKEYKLPAAQGAVYKGKVVMLINAHAISAAESACLIVEAATDVTFIGGPTVGADGAVTTVTLPGLLPGGISITFSGYDLRHADGRQLQRVGVQPHVKVEPTPQGIREGRDEVLERAFEYLKQNRQR